MITIYCVHQSATNSNEQQCNINWQKCDKNQKSKASTINNRTTIKSQKKKKEISKKTKFTCTTGR